MPNQLPKPVQQLLNEADSIRRKLELEREKLRTPGPKAHKVKYKQGASFAGKTPKELDRLMAATGEAIGAKYPGNKRRGKGKLYGDLVEQFDRLKSLGITLPRGGSLSEEACRHGLTEILREHGYLPLNEKDVPPGAVDRALINGELRAKLGHKLARIFDRVASAVENHPA